MFGAEQVLCHEIHRLHHPRTTTGAETADLLKDLTERIGATFVCAGIDVVATLLSGRVRGAQLAGRPSLVECGAFAARLGKREPFTELIAGVEAALDLLPQRTVGGIDSLARLIRQAAITAILDGTERTTSTSLDAVRLDHLAETHHHPGTPAPRHPG
ncbi:ATP/GTP-binding protein, partial [Streptomyces sp. SID3343]|uniref:ATP/GTP-binding protein n=1 Tax=Streptomyces sp. SID3343 TaxID=2690260 RepID=UPI0031F84113